MAETYQKLADAVEANHLEVNFSLQQEDARVAYSKKNKALCSLLNSTSKQIKAQGNGRRPCVIQVADQPATKSGPKKQKGAGNEKAPPE